jgi:RNA polymerase sigma factor (sigma-70 family)
MLRSKDATVPEFEAYLREHTRELLKYAYFLTGSQEEAQDAVHEVVTRLLGRDLQSIENVHAYARRAVSNECASRARSLWRRQHSAQVLRQEWSRTLTVQPDPYQRVEVMSALSRLPLKQRTAVVLRYYEDLPDSDIAYVLNCSEATVRTTLARARAKLRDILEED